MKDLNRLNNLMSEQKLEEVAGGIPIHIEAVVAERRPRGLTADDTITILSKTEKSRRNGDMGVWWITSAPV